MRSLPAERLHLLRTQLKVPDAVSDTDAAQFLSAALLAYGSRCILAECWTYIES